MSKKRTMRDYRNGNKAPKISRSKRPQKLPEVEAFDETAEVEEALTALGEDTEADQAEAESVLEDASVQEEVPAVVRDPRFPDEQPAMSHVNGGID